MCRALKILCAASTTDQLMALKRAAVSVHWELVGGAVSLPELVEHVDRHEPDVVVIDEGLGSAAVEAVRASRPSARLVTVGEVAGADASARAVDEIRDAILGVPRPGGPVLR